MPAPFKPFSLFLPFKPSPSRLTTILLLTLLGAGDAHMPHLTKPWSQLADLTEDQKSQLIQIHRAARAQIQQILAQERRDSLAILTQKQLDQLRDIEDQKTVDRKLAATQSSDDSP